MELLYLWIKDFNNIKEQGFQFGGKYFISYDKLNNVFNFKKNPKYIEDFFKGEEWKEGDGIIKSVTAIVGANGSGKSSVLEFLCRQMKRKHIAARIDKKDYSERIIIHKIEAKICIYESNDTNEKWFSIPEEENSFTISLNNPEETNTLTNGTRFQQDCIPIYFSTDIYDRVTKAWLQDYELLNISNSYYYYKDRVFGISYDREFNSSVAFKDYPDRIFSENLKRQLSFIRDTADWFFNRFKIKPIDKVELYVLQDYAHTTEYRELFIQLSNRFFPKNDLELFKMMLITASLRAYLYPSKALKEKLKIDPKDYLNQLINNANNIFDLAYKFLENFEGITPEIHNIFDAEVKMNDFKIPETIKFLKFIDEKLTANCVYPKNPGDSPLNDYNLNNKRHEGPVFFNPNSFLIDIGLAYDFVELYRNHLERYATEDYIQFKYPNLSNGEIALLNFYSRLPYIYNNEVEDFERFKNIRYTDTSNILLIIDEGDTYLHPQWQKKYLDNLLEFLPALFKGKRIQLIVTSHSPLFLSDLPRENVIFLDRNESGESKVSDLENRKETLGANIHTLLSDSFFIKDGLIGDFARKKINWVINILQDGTLEEVTGNKEKIGNIINMVGEPIIKNKLNQLLSSRLNINLMNVDEKMRDLQRQIDELKKRQDDTN